MEGDGEMNNVLCGDCIALIPLLKTMCDGVLTSPPYNLGKNPNHGTAKRGDDKLYDEYKDNKTSEEYVSMMVNLFKALETVVKNKGVALVNMSYSSKGASLPYHTWWR